jgi:hypothetical protein
MFAVVGLLATLAVYALISRWAIWQKTLVALAATGVIIMIALASGAETRGSVAWWQQPLCRNLLLYAFMLAGMMFRAAWDQLEAWRQHNAQAGVRRKRQPQFDFWEFVYPVLPSLALFQGVLWLAGQNELSFQLGLGSFQNGFFRHALLAKTKQTFESTGAKA